MIQNLSKENFWNALMEKYPGAVDHFCKWIDDYKKEVGWNVLFGEAVKFHDLPFEMQNGILARYEMELFNSVNQYASVAGHYRHQVENIFRMLQRKIILRLEKLN